MSSIENHTFVTSDHVANLVIECSNVDKQRGRLKTKVAVDFAFQARQ